MSQEIKILNRPCGRFIFVLRVAGLEPVVKGSNRRRKADVNMPVSIANEPRW